MISKCSTDRNTHSIHRMVTQTEFSINESQVISQHVKEKVTLISQWEKLKPIK